MPPRLIAAFLLVVSCLHSPNLVTAGEAAHSRTLDLIESHRSSLLELFSRVPDRVEDPRNEYFLLSVLKSSVLPVLGWGHVDEDGSMRAVSNGTRDGCWIMVLDEGHPELAEGSPTLLTTEMGGLLVVRVRPDAISPEMAGVFLAHELLHAYQRLAKLTMSRDVKEFDAYDAEARALALSTNVDVDRVMKSFAQELMTQTTSDIIDLISAEPGRLSTAIDRLEDRLQLSESASRAERQMRDGLFVAMLSSHLSKALGLTHEQSANELQSLLEAASLYH